MVALFQMTYVGAPMVYYGTEAGMWGAHDPDDRLPMVWPDLTFEPQAIDPRGKAREPDDVNFDKTLHDFYEKVIHLRSEHVVFDTGSYQELGAFDKESSFAFLREAGDEAYVVLLNRSDEPQAIEVKIPNESLARLGEKSTIFSTRDGADITIAPSDNGLKVTLPGLTGIVIGAGQKAAE